MPKPQATQSGLPNPALPIAVTPRSRRQFLRNTMGAGLVATVFPACQKIREILPGHTPDETISLGSGDNGLLNYCYLLQQLEAAYYTKVVLSPFDDIREHETANLISIYNHEIAHREFYRSLLGNNAIVALEFKFKTINFKSREVVWQTARSFEDLVIAAYGGIANRIVDRKLSILNTKVLSVDARHAAVVAELNMFGSFAQAVGPNGSDPVWTPSQVMAIAQLYIVNKIDFSGIKF